MKILTAAYVLTMKAKNECIKNGAVLIDDQKIKAIGTKAELIQQYPHVIVLDYPHALLMPGLINTHCHSGLLRGTAEGLPVWD
nr:hypothetical protein [Acinetobacter sp. BY419]